MIVGRVHIAGVGGRNVSLSPVQGSKEKQELAKLKAGKSTKPAELSVSHRMMTENPSSQDIRGTWVARAERFLRQLDLISIQLPKSQESKYPKPLEYFLDSCWELIGKPASWPERLLVSEVGPLLRVDCIRGLVIPSIEVPSSLYYCKLEVVTNEQGEAKAVLQHFLHVEVLESIIDQAVLQVLQMRSLPPLALNSNELLYDSPITPGVEAIDVNTPV